MAKFFFALLLTRKEGVWVIETPWATNSAHPCITQSGAHTSPSSDITGEATPYPQRAASPTLYVSDLRSVSSMVCDCDDRSAGS